MREVERGDEVREDEGERDIRGRARDEGVTWLRWKSKLQPAAHWHRSKKTQQVSRKIQMKRYKTKLLGFPGALIRLTRHERTMVISNETNEFDSNKPYQVLTASNREIMIKTRTFIRYTFVNGKNKKQIAIAKPGRLPSHPRATLKIFDTKSDFGDTVRKRTRIVCRLVVKNLIELRVRTRRRWRRDRLPSRHCHHITSHQLYQSNRV
jgi:hypothetical protein